MRLLVTRASEDADRTKKRLRALGHTVILSPVTEVVGTGAACPSGVIDAVLASSGHAFKFPMEGLSPEAKRVMPLYVIGARTADVAHSKGFKGETTIADTSALMVFALSKLLVRPKRFIYLAGRDRKPDLEIAFNAIGQRLDVVEVYEARALEALAPEALRALRHNAIDGVLHFSQRSAVLFETMASDAKMDIRKLAHFCISEEVAAKLRELGCTKVHASSRPNETDLVALTTGF